MERRPRRSDYKEVWTALSDTIDRAKLHVGGVTDEDAFRVSGEHTLGLLQETVGLLLEDVVVEIGCGVGRVGKYVAPLCRRWIGCDVSANMLRFAAERLQGLNNIELREIFGYGLEGIHDSSVTVVYSTVVFMHLESWDRYRYVQEAMRVLQPGGRIYIDNVNLCSNEGWEVFKAHLAFAPSDRPPHMTECSTPQELETYLKRAGCTDVRIKTDDAFVRGWGVKR